jgi:dienelactone hydrolase
MSAPACCPPGSWPQILRSRQELNQEDVQHPLKGVVITIESGSEFDLPVYLVESQQETCRGGIMVIPDIYSVRALTPHVRSGDRIGAICDGLADAGYTVVLPSIFRDKPFDLAIAGPEDGDFEKFSAFSQGGGVDWFKSNNYAKVGPDVQAAAKYLREKTNGGSIGVLGFCYGAWLLSKASSTGDVEFQCAVGCHPATVLEEAVFGNDQLAMLQSLCQPTMFLCAGNDSPIFVNDGAGKAALESTGGGVVEYGDMLHGWVSRGDVSDPKVKIGVEKAINDIIGFFANNMPKVE